MPAGVASVRPIAAPFSDAAAAAIHARPSQIMRMAGPVSEEAE